MNEITEKRASWSDFKKSIVEQVSIVGNVVIVTYRGKPKLKVTAWIRPSQEVSLRHVPWQLARGFDLWDWLGITPCIITMGQRKTPVAVVERWSDDEQSSE